MNLGGSLGPDWEEGAGQTNAERGGSLRLVTGQPLICQPLIDQRVIQLCVNSHRTRLWKSRGFGSHGIDSG